MKISVRLAWTIHSMQGAKNFDIFCCERGKSHIDARTGGDARTGPWLYILPSIFSCKISIRGPLHEQRYRIRKVLRVDYISGGLYQLKMCKRAGTVHISCSGSYLIVPFIHVFRVPLVWHLSRLFVSLFKDSSRTLLPSVLLPWTEVSSTSYFYHKEQ